MNRFLILVSVLLALGVVGCSPPPKTERMVVPVAVRQVRIKEWRSYDSPTGHYVYVDGQVENLSDRPMKYVQVDLVYRDTSGKMLGGEATYILCDVLQPHDTCLWKFIVPKPAGYATSAVRILDAEWAD